MIFYILLAFASLVTGFFLGKCIYRKKYKQENSNILNCLFVPKAGSNLVAYTVATHKTPGLERLINSFKKSNIPLVILGFGLVWFGLVWFGLVWRHFRWLAKRDLRVIFFNVM